MGLTKKWQAAAALALSAATLAGCTGLNGFGGLPGTRPDGTDGPCEAGGISVSTKRPISTVGSSDVLTVRSKSGEIYHLHVPYQPGKLSQKGLGDFPNVNACIEKYTGQKTSSSCVERRAFVLNTKPSASLGNRFDIYQANSSTHTYYILDPHASMLPPSLTWNGPSAGALTRCLESPFATGSTPG